MPHPLTLQVLDGLELGRVYEGLSAPVTLGTGPDCSVQIVDDRVQVLHARLEEHEGQLVLVEFEHPVILVNLVPDPRQLRRVVEIGDMLTLGRTVLVLGTPEQITERLTKINEAASQLVELDPDEPSSSQDLLGPTLE